jgi:AraC-like DNA-binding protein
LVLQAFALVAGVIGYALALSQSLLYKKIKALTNLSVVEFIRSIRLNYAMEKLCSGEYNVTELT